MEYMQPMELGISHSPPWGYLFKYIGYRKSILFGGILMALGHFFMAFPTVFSFTETVINYG